MNKVLPIIVIVVIVGAVIGSQTFLKRGEQVEAPGGAQVGQEAPVQEEKGFTGKLKDALLLGQSMECTWTKEGKDFATAFIKDKKVYSEAIYEDKKMYSIVRDNCVYTWGEGQTQGFKMCFEPTEAEDNWMDMEGAPPADIDYHCRPTMLTDAKFEPPTNVNFTSLEEMMRGGE